MLACSYFQIIVHHCGKSKGLQIATHIHSQEEGEMDARMLACWLVFGLISPLHMGQGSLPREWCPLQWTVSSSTSKTALHRHVHRATQCRQSLPWMTLGCVQLTGKAPRTHTQLVVEDSDSLTSSHMGLVSCILLFVVPIETMEHIYNMYILYIEV